jgi:hypothetical protein
VRAARSGRKRGHGRRTASRRGGLARLSTARPTRTSRTSPRRGIPTARRATPKGVNRPRNPRTREGAERPTASESDARCPEAWPPGLGERGRGCGYVPMGEVGPGGPGPGDTRKQHRARRISGAAPGQEGRRLSHRGGAPVSGPEGAPPRTAPTPTPDTGAAQSRAPPSRAAHDLRRCTPLCGSSFVTGALTLRSGAPSI